MHSHAAKMDRERDLPDFVMDVGSRRVQQLLRVDVVSGAIDLLQGCGKFRDTPKDAVQCSIFFVNVLHPLSFDRSASSSIGVAQKGGLHVDLEEEKARCVVKTLQASHSNSRPARSH